MLTAAEHTARNHAQSVERATRLRLAETGYQTLRSVECSFGDGRIMLRGEVPSYYHKQLAQECVRHAPHVNQIINHIEVVSQ
jgi:osmotically-inducible protein OsmY